MRDHLSATANRGWCLSTQWVRNRAEEWRRCRDCEARVSPWDECCPHCGSGQPIKVSVSSVIVMGVSFAFAVLLVVKVFYS